MTTVPSGGGGAGAGVEVGAGVGVGVGAGVGVGVGDGVGVGIGVGVGVAVAVGKGIGVAVPLGLETGAGLGVELGADGGCGVGVGSRGAVVGVAWCNCLVGGVVGAEAVGVGPPARTGSMVGTRVGGAAGGTAVPGRSARWVAGGAWVGSDVGEVVMPHAMTSRARQAPPARKAPHVFPIPALGAQPWGGLLLEGRSLNVTQLEYTRKLGRLEVSIADGDWVFPLRSSSSSGLACDEPSFVASSDLVIDRGMTAR